MFYITITHVCFFFSLNKQHKNIAKKERSKEVKEMEARSKMCSDEDSKMCSDEDGGPVEDGGVFM